MIQLPDEDNASPDSGEEGPRYEYDPAHYKALPVSPLIKDLFPMITEYKPKKIEMAYNLMPFFPEMIPAIGDIDAFIKSSYSSDQLVGRGNEVADEMSNPF